MIAIPFHESERGMSLVFGHLIISPLCRAFQRWKDQPQMGKYIANPYAPCMVYLPTKLSDFVRVNVGKYSSTMVRIWPRFESHFHPETSWKHVMMTPKATFNHGPMSPMSLMSNLWGPTPNSAKKVVGPSSFRFEIQKPWQLPVTLYHPSQVFRMKQYKTLTSTAEAFPKR